MANGRDPEDDPLFRTFAPDARREERPSGGDPLFQTFAPEGGVPRGTDPDAGELEPVRARPPEGRERPEPSLPVREARQPAGQAPGAESLMLPRIGGPAREAFHELAEPEPEERRPRRSVMERFTRGSAGLSEGPRAPDQRTELEKGILTGLSSNVVGVGEVAENFTGLTGRFGRLDMDEADVRAQNLSNAARRFQRDNAGRVTEFTEIGNLRDLADWSAFALGQGVGSTFAPLLGSVIGGGIGAATGGPAGGVAGGVAGAFLPSYGLLLGEIRGELESEGIPDEVIDSVAPRLAVPAAALEGLLPASIGIGLRKQVTSQVGRSLARRMARGTLKGMLTEGGTEATQQAISSGAAAALSQDREFFTPDTFLELFNSAMAGALPGAAFGAGGTLTEGALAPEAIPETEGAEGPGREELVAALEEYRRSIQGETLEAEAAEGPAPAPAEAPAAEEGVPPTEGPAEGPEPAEAIYEPPETEEDFVPETGRAPVRDRGSDSQVELADGRTLPVEYAIVDVGQTTISHDPVTFQPNPEFPEGIQDRRYESDAGAQDLVVDRSGDLRPSLLLDQTTLATNGPPIMRPDGLTVSGNERTMLIRRAREMHPALYQDYVTELVERAESFGIPRERAQNRIEGMLERGQTPALARVLTGPQPASRPALRSIMAAANEVGTKSRDPLAEAAVQAARLREADGPLQFFEETIQPEETIRSYLDRADGRQFLQGLIQNGVIPRTQTSRFRDSRDGSPTPEGKQLIERMLLGAAIQDPGVVDRAPNGWLQKIEKAIPAIIETQSNDDWNLSPVLQEALELGTAVAANDEVRNVETFVTQIELEGPRFSPAAETLARFIEENSPNEVAGAIRQYARRVRDAREAQESYDVFGEDFPTAAEEFSRIFGGELEPGTLEEVALDPREQSELEEAQAWLESIADDPRVVEARERAIQPGDPNETIQLFPPGESPARDEMRATWLDTVWDNGGFASQERWFKEVGITEPYEVARESKLFIIIGPPASWKSGLANPLLAETLSRLVDADEFKALTPEFKESGTSAGEVHKESAYLVGQTLEAAMAQGENIVMPAVGKTLRDEEGDGLAQQIEAAERMGYEVHLIYNELSPLKAAQRALARFFSTGRWVPPDYIIDIVWKKPARSYELLKDSPLLTSAERYSNDVARGEQPILLESIGSPAVEIPSQRSRQATGVPRGRERTNARTGGPETARATPRARATGGLPGRDTGRVELEPEEELQRETPDAEQYHVDRVAQELYGLEWIEYAGEARPRSLVELLSQAIDNAQDEETLENILEIMDTEAERIGPADVAMLRERAQEHAEETDLELGLEVQEGLFGAQDRTLTGEEQRSLFPEAGPEGLTESEARARNTIERLRPIIAAGHGSNAELEQYAEALKLMHRNELLDNEEVTARARRLEREIESIATEDQAELFELRLWDRRPTQDRPVPLWRQRRNEWAGEPPVQPTSPEYQEWKRKDRLWSQAMREAISEGNISVDDAQELGYRPSGLEAPLPSEPLYHVTTSRSSVLDVGIRSQAQSSLAERQVLGGTDGTNIPLTTDRSRANAFRDSVLLARRFLRGDMTVEELLELAQEPREARRPFAGQVGRMYDRTWTYGEELPSELQGELELEARAELLNRYFMFREAAGGPRDPGFDVADAETLANFRPSELAIVEVRPANPRVMGEQPTQGDWRVQSSRAIEVETVDGRPPAAWKPAEESGPTEPGYATAVIAEELGLELLSEERLRDTPERARTGPEEDVTPLSQVREDIEEVLGRPIKQGRLRRLAQAFGVYQVTPETMRTRARNDIHSIAHELGHHMHKLLFVRAVPRFDPRNPGKGLPLAPLRKWSSELRPLAEGISAENIAEGWAEYWRLWVTNREVAEQKAPELTRYLEERLSREYVTIFEGIRRWQGWLEGYYRAAPWSRVRSRTAYSEDHMGWARNWRRGLLRTYQEVMDRFVPLSAAQRDLLDMGWQERIQHLNENPELIPKMMADLIDGAAGMADHWVHFGPVDYETGQPSGTASLVEILEPVAEHLEDFEDYLIARRVLHLQEERGLDQGYDNDDLQATIDHHLEEWPYFEQVADQLHDFQQELLEYMVDAGVILEETAEAFREGNPFYVPLYKVQDPLGEHGFKEGGAHLFSPFKRIGDSDRDVVPPLESIVKNIYFYTKLVQRQRVQGALAGMAELHGSGRWIREIDAPNVPTNVGRDEVVDWMRKALADELGFRGLDDSLLKDVGAILPELMTVFRPGDYYGAENVISHVVTEEDPDTGELRQVRKWFEVEEEIFRALEHNSPAANSKLASIFAFPAKLLRVGATSLSPGFISRNPFRDQLSAGVQSEYGYTPFVDLVPALFHILGRSDRYAAFLRSGGSFSALVDMDRDAVAGSLARLREGPIKHVIKNPLNALQALSAALENTTRMGEFLNTLRAGGETTGVIGRWRRDFDPTARAEAEARVEGATREEAALAGWMAREISTQFSTHGASGSIQVIHRISAFLNARWQSYARLARAAKNDPAGFSLRAFSMLTIPTIMLYMMNRDDEEYWELPQWMRDLHWMIKLPNVTKDLVPEALFDTVSSGEDAGFLERLLSPFVAQGDTVWVRLPIPWELGLVFKTLPERVLEWWDADDPEGLEEAVKQNFWQSFTGTVLPIPTFATPIIENWANYSMFRQSPIDPPFENAPPQYIRRPGTSEVAIGMVEAMERLGVYSIPGTEKILGSPQKVDNLLYGYGGGFTRLVTDLASAGLRVTGALENVQRVQTLADVPAVGGFIGRQNGFGSDSEERFRRRWERIRGTRAAMQLLERENRLEQLRREREDPEVQRDLELYARYSNVANTLSSLYSQANSIERNERLTNEEKAERISELGQRATELTRRTIDRELPSEHDFPLTPPFLRPER